MLTLLSILIITAGTIVIILWQLGIILPNIVITNIAINGVVIPNIANSSNFYLLSAIAQSLAAVLALVFTISLIAIQISSKYSYRILGRFFDWVTGLYMGLFVVSILFPFGLLAYPQLEFLKVSVGLSAMCLILLIPFLWRFRSRLSAENILDDTMRKAIKLVRKKCEEESSELLTIDNFIMSAYVQKDYDTFEKGMECITEIAIEAYLRMGENVVSQVI